MIIDAIRWKIISVIIEIEGIIRKVGIKDKRYSNLLKYKNKYYNKRCFICATGPSLKKEDLEMLNNEYTFGVNSICSIYEETKWRPSFFVFQDFPIYEMYEDLINSSKKTVVFSGDPLVDYKRSGNIKIKVKWVRFPLNWAYHKYAGLKGRPFVKFSKDAYRRLFSGYTVTYSAIQLAIYMGFSEIYLLGVDCNYIGGKKNHFKLMKNEFVRNPIVAKSESDAQMLAYEVARKETLNNNIRIYNVTRGGKLEIFNRKVLEEVLNEA